MLGVNQIYHSDIFALCQQIEDASIDMILCDLPYGTTACSWDSIIPIEPMWEQFKRVIKPKGAIVLTASQPFTSRLVSSNYEMFRYEWIWVKNRKTNFLNAKIMPLKQHENILVFGYKQPDYYPQMIASTGHGRGGNDRGTNVYGKFDDYSYLANEYYPTSLIEIPHDSEVSVTFKHKPNRSKRHPTQKPLALFEYLIRTYTLEGQTVFDPCVGSGTTAIAAQNTNRRFICGDSSEEYVLMARKRLQDSDPYQATELSNGQKQLSLFQDLED